MGKSILFLGYDRDRTQLISCLEEQGCKVDHTQEALNSPEAYGEYDLMVSFGYRHIIKKSFIDGYQGDILNLHIAYLPWNRGAHPNFWAFADNTPHGVTIHLVDEGVDTGAILYQRYVNFDSEKTFSETNSRLILEIEKLFIDNLAEIMAQQYVPKPQRGSGSYHCVADLPEFPGGWNADVNDAIRWFDQRMAESVSEKRMLIDELEARCPKNDVKWMEAVRLAFKCAPKKAAQIVGRIYCDDSKILELLTKISRLG